MNKAGLIGGALLIVAGTLSAADIRDLLKRPGGASGTNSLTSISEAEVVKGLKEALAKGVQYSITNLGKAGGFLNSADVKIPMPDRLAQAEKALRSLKQDQVADQFIATMNQAAEQAVPEAAALFGEAIQNMSLADAKALLQGPEDAATQYFRKTSEGRLEEKMLPIIKKATEAAGVTASYKRMMEKAGPVASLLNRDGKSADVDRYIADKAADGLFKRIADQEKLIRKNPAARTTDILKKVFGAGAKRAN